jgi:hypothetical protein
MARNLYVETLLQLKWISRNWQEALGFYSEFPQGEVSLFLLLSLGLDGQLQARHIPLTKLINDENCLTPDTN